MTAWLVVAAVAIGSYLLRVSMFAVVGRRSLPRWTERPMAFVGPAAIAALTSSMLLTRGGSIDPPPIAELIAVTVGFVVVRRTGNVAHAFAVGLPAYWLVTAVPL